MIIPIFSCCFLVLGYFPGGLLGAYKANQASGYYDEGRTGYFLTQAGITRITAAQVDAARTAWPREHNYPDDWTGQTGSKP